MDLLSTIRKSGSRGGVNFSWDDVASSVHRENYLGHSLKAPVGRWAKGRDLNWYAKSDATPADSTSTAETDDERRARERLEEVRKVKEAEEDAIARALGLPVKVRDTTGANAIEVEPKRQMGPVSGPPTKEMGDDSSRRERPRRHDDDRRDGRRHRDRDRDDRRDRRHSRDRDRGHGQGRRDRDEGRRKRDGSRDRNGGREERRPRRDRDRSRSAQRGDRRTREGSRQRYRSRSRDHYRRRSPDRNPRR